MTRCSSQVSLVTYEARAPEIASTRSRPDRSSMCELYHLLHVFIRTGVFVVMRSHILTLVWMIGLLDVVSGAPVSGSTLCESGKYMDDVTRRCAPCSDICLNAALQRTEDACNSLCGGVAGAHTKDTNSNDNKKGILIGTIIPAIIILAVIVFITAKYRKQIRGQIIRIASYISLALSDPADPDTQDIELEVPAPRRDPDQPQDQGLREEAELERGRMQDGHVDYPQPGRSEEVEDGDSSPETRQKIFQIGDTERIPVSVEAEQDPSPSDPLISPSVQKGK